MKEHEIERRQQRVLPWRSLFSSHLALILLHSQISQNPSTIALQDSSLQTRHSVIAVCASASRAHRSGPRGAPPALERCLARVLTSGASGFRLSGKPLLTSDAYELGPGMRKRHRGSEEEHDALIGTGKARGRNQPWDEQEGSSDFMSQVSIPIFLVCCHLGWKVWRVCVPSRCRAVGPVVAQKL